MSAHAETPGHAAARRAGYGTAGHLDRVMLGLIVALASEFMLFGAFFTAFFYIRYTNYPVYPPEPFEMPVDSTGINTAILVSSSFTMHWALVSAKRDNRRGMTLGLLFTLIMGLTFLALQIREYNLLHGEGFTPEHGAFASVFFGLTGLHGIHVLVGAILLDDRARAHAARPLLTREAHGPRAIGHLLALRRRRLGRALHARLPALQRRSRVALAGLEGHSGAALSAERRVERAAEVAHEVDAEERHPPGAADQVRVGRGRARAGREEQDDARQRAAAPPAPPGSARGRRSGSAPGRARAREPQRGPTRRPCR